MALCRFYNRSLLTSDQRDCIDIVLVSPRNPLNIGAVARAMANFGFARLTVVAPYEPHWREARSAVGAPQLLTDARETASLADAVRECKLVIGTGTLTHRKPEQPVMQLDTLAPRVAHVLSPGSRVAVVFGPEKHGLTREDLSWCHLLVEIPTDSRQPSMNLGQATAVFLYEIATRFESDPTANGRDRTPDPAPTTSGDLDILGGLIEEVMAEAKYSPKSMEGANRHDLRVMLRRLHLNAATAEGRSGFSGGSCGD